MQHLHSGATISDATTEDINTIEWDVGINKKKTKNKKREVESAKRTTVDRQTQGALVLITERQGSKREEKDHIFILKNRRFFLFAVIRGGNTPH